MQLNAVPPTVGTIIDKEILADQEDESGKARKPFRVLENPGGKEDEAAN